MILLKYDHSHEIIVDSQEWHHKEGFNLGAKEQLKKVVEHIEKYVFYMDTRGYSSLKPNATRNWQALLKEVE